MMPRNGKRAGGQIKLMLRVTGNCFREMASAELVEYSSVQVCKVDKNGKYASAM
jgi:hypothetical protein